MKSVVVLSGGGAKGCFQVGVLKALTQRGLQVSGIYGTSVGALNAAGFASGGAGRLEEIWRQIEKKSDILKFNWSSLLFLSKGLYSTAPLRGLLDKYAGPPYACKATACKVSLLTGKIMYGNSDEPDFIDSVEASAAIPGIMNPVKDEFVDGGVREQTPLAQAFADHPDIDEIIVILCNPYRPDPEKDGWSIGNWLKNAMRAVDVMEHEVMITDIETCLEKNNNPQYRKVKVKVYCPNEQVCDTLEFDPKKIQRGITQGYLAGLTDPFLEV